MSLPQQKFREIVFQLLYSYDLGKSHEEDMLPLIMKELSVTRKAVKEAAERAQKIQEMWPEIDKEITQSSQSYTFERIQSVERNILRLGVYEILYDEEIPPKVAISEAIRLARKFGSPESANFVNAVLDHIYKLGNGAKPDNSAITETFEKLIESEEIAREASNKKNGEKENNVL